MNATIQSEIQAPALATPERQSKSFSDLDLQLSRRLDWRFLLANTQLENVAYIGKQKPSLVAGLEKFSACLTIVSSKTAEALPGTFDLVVVASATPPVFECAARILKNGGWIYVEVGFSARLRAKLQGLNGFRTDLLCAGLRDVRAYWHRPSFETCREIVPLDDRVALDYVLSRQQADFADKLKSRAARFASQTGLLPFVLPSVSLLACKGSER